MNKEKEVENFMEIVSDPETRVALTTRSHYYFFYIYFSGYIQHDIAPFQKQMFAITEDNGVPLTVIVSFRNSGKSTLITMSYVLWAILGIQKKRFICIISQTQEQARTHFRSLKKELENNTLLRDDLGPFREEEEWNSSTLVLTKYNARIMIASRDQSFRGVRHREVRPDLIICDDIEDINSVRTKEGRDHTYNWFNSEVVPLGDLGTKIVVVGNKLHKDSLIKRLEDEIIGGDRKGIYREYPVIKSNGKILWPGKYPNQEAIDELKAKTSYLSWNREYLLRIIDDQEPVVDREWVRYYQEIPPSNYDHRRTFAVGIDLAVSEKEKADYSALVSCEIIGTGDDMKIYILPNPINSRMRLPVTADTTINLVGSWGERASYMVYVEDVGQQRGLVQLLEDRGINACGVLIGRNDKRTRLAIVSEYIRSGKIIFPEKGANALMMQILDFGVESHDDLVDAFTTLILGIMNNPPVQFVGRIRLGGLM